MISRYLSGSVFGLCSVALLMVSLPAAQVASAEGKVKPIKEIYEPKGSFDPAKYAKVAVVQWASTEPTPVGVTAARAEEFKSGTRRTLEHFIRESAGRGAELVITPEFSVVGYPDFPELPPEEDEYRNREDLAPYVETVPGPTTQFFSGLARELHIYIHVGFAEVETPTGKYFNTVVAIDPSGNIAAKYRKMNLYEGENNFLSAGEGGATYDSPFGKIGLIICADVFSPQPLSEYGSVDVLALSTSWIGYNTGMPAFRRAAHGAGKYLLAANQTYFPDSGVVNPDGTIQSHIRQTTGMAYGYLPRRR